MNKAMNPISASLARSPTQDALPTAMRTVWRVLIERFWVFVGITAVLFIAAAIAVMMMTPLYSAASLLKVDPTATPIAGVDSTTRPNQVDRASIQSEVSVIQSRDLAKVVAKKLNLINDPEFDYSMGDPAAASGPGMDARLDGIAGALLDSTYVSLDEASYVITIDVTSPDGEKAARIANAFAEAYVTNNVGTRTGTAAKESEWLSQRRAALEGEVQSADSQVAQYKMRAGIVEGGANGTITDQQVGPIASALASAESEAAEARAKLASARTQISAGNMDAVANVLNSPVVTNLRSQRAEVLRNRDEITSRYGPRHPEAIKVSQQLASLDEQIGQEAKRVTISLESTAKAAEARASSLSGTLSRLRADQARNTGASVTADTLERSAAAKRAAYDQLAKAEQDAEQAARNSLANVRIIELARAPDRPKSPNKPLLLGTALLLAMLCGAAVITIQEILTRGVRTVSDVEVKLGIPLVGAVPKLGSSVTKTTLPADYLVDKPMTFYAEAFRSLRSALLLSGNDKLPSVVTVTSALPGEGKSTTALALARAMAMAGDRVILVDCDFRRGGIQAQTGYVSEHTLYDVLSKGTDPALAIKPDRVENVHLLANNESVYTPKDLFNGKPMEQLLAGLRPQYDTIILDTPPLLGVADARVLATLGEVVLLVVGWDKTPLDAVEKALGMLQQDQARLLGAVLTAVDPNAELMGSNYYSSKYASYYRE